MPRKRRAWFPNGNGKVVNRGGTLPGYYVFWRDTGRYRSRCFDKKRAARAFLIAKNRGFERLAAGGLLPIDIIEATVELMSACSLLADSTQRQMGFTLGQFAKHVGIHTPIAELTARSVDSYLGTLDTLSESSIARHLRYIKRLFRWCIEREYVERDITKGVTVKPRTAVRELPAIPTDQDIARLLRAIQDPAMRIACTLALTLGMDRGVVASLTAANFDLKSKQVTFQRIKSARSHPSIVTAPLHHSLIAPLRRLFVPSEPHQPIFAGYARQAWYQRARKDAGHPWSVLRVVDFRKIASMRMQRVGVPLAQVQKILDHSTPAVTARHYSPVDLAALQAFDKLRLPTFSDTSPKKKRRPA